jgi:hypothetical protein
MRILFPLLFFISVFTSCNENNCRCEDLLIDEDSLARYSEPASEEEEEIFRLYLEQQKIKQEIQTKTDHYKKKLDEIFDGEEGEIYRKATNFYMGTEAGSVPEMDLNTLEDKINTWEEKNNPDSIFKYRNLAAWKAMEDFSVYKSAEHLLRNIDMLRSLSEPPFEKLAMTEFNLASIYLADKYYHEYVTDHIYTGIKYAEEAKDSSLILQGLLLEIHSEELFSNYGKAAEAVKLATCKFQNQLRSDLHSLLNLAAKIVSESSAKAMCEDIYQHLLVTIETAPAIQEPNLTASTARIAWHRNQKEDFEKYLKRMEDINRSVLSLSEERNIIEQLQMLYSLSKNKEKLNSVFEMLVALDERQVILQKEIIELEKQFRTSQLEMQRKMMETEHEIREIHMKMRRENRKANYRTGIQNIPLFTGTCKDSLNRISEYKEGKLVR